jgi:hypothetical protein
MTRNKQYCRMFGAPLALLVMLVLMSFTSSETASAGSPTAPKKEVAKLAKVTERIIHFPPQSLGGLYVVPKVTKAMLYGENELAVAKDTVKIKIPAGYELYLRANATLLENPSELDKLPPDCLDCLEFRSALFNLDDEQFGTKLLSHVNKLTGLRVLKITALEPDDVGVSSLKSMKKLQILNVNVGRLEGSCLKDLQTLPDLEELDISDNPLNLNNFAYIAKFPALKHLEAHRCRLNKGAIQQISKCSTLSDLNLSGNPMVQDDCAEYLSKMPNLQVLDLTSTKMTGRGLKQLQNLKNLQYIAITSSLISPEALIDIHKALPHTHIEMKGPSAAVTKENRSIFAPVTK